MWQPEEDLTGRLLAATPDLGDPNFDRTVVLLLEHGADGSVGVILNRPSPLPVADLLPTWAPIVTPPDVLFQGGPVQVDGVLALAELDGTPPSGANLLLPGVYSLDLDEDPGAVAPALRRARFFAGYSGWGPGQLDAELLLGSWFTVASRPGDLFLEDLDDLWARVVRRKGGTFSTFPADPRSN